MATENKDFKVKHGLSVTGGASFGESIAIGEPTENTHAATKFYVDEQVAGAAGFSAVLAATTQNLSLSELVPGFFVDGFQVDVGNRILVKNQTNQSQNGIYLVNSSGPATRSIDFDTSEKVFPGAQIYVVFGNLNAETTWVLSSYNNSLGVDPLIFTFFGPVKPGSGLILENDVLTVDESSLAAVFVDENQIVGLDPGITKSSLTVIGELESLVVNGVADFAADVEIDGTLDVLGPRVTFSQDFEVEGNSTFSGNAEFLGEVIVTSPTEPNHAVNKDYVDNLLDQEQVEITTIDDLSNYFNGFESRFKPTYQGIPVTLQNPFNLLLSIDGIIQSVGYPDYVWQSVMPRVGFRIDNDGYIAFPEPIPPGSGFDARVLVGSNVTKQTKIYPFKAMDIVLGGY